MWRTVFVRRFDGGRRVISPSIRVDLDEVLFDCAFEAFLDAADKILAPAPVGDPSGNAVVAFFLYGFMAQNMLVRLSRTETSQRMLSGRGQAGMVKLAETSLQLIEHNLLPVLDRCRSLEAYGVDVAARLEDEPSVPWASERSCVSPRLRPAPPTSSRSSRQMIWPGWTPRSRMRETAPRVGRKRSPARPTCTARRRSSSRPPGFG